MSKRVIIIDDDPAYCRIIKHNFRDAFDYHADAVTDVQEMYQMIEQAEKLNNPYRIATIDMDFKISDAQEKDVFEPKGRQILRYIKEKHPYITCIMISGAPVTPSEILMMRDRFGLDFFIAKNRFEPMVFRAYVEHAVQFNQQQQQTKQATALTTIPGKETEKIFISYRRSASWGVAIALQQHLRASGYDVFWDVKSIGSDDFEPYIIKYIVNCDYFIVLLADTTLESRWVRKEIELALNAGVKIIPILLDDFQLYEDGVLPDNFSQLKDKNAIQLTPDNFEGKMNTLVNQFLSTV